MIYRPVIMKRLLASNLVGRFAVPSVRPAVATEGFDRFSPTFGRRSYHSEYDDSDDDEEEITPICDRREDDENCYLSIHMPGYNKGDVKSKIKGHMYHRLIIEGNKVQEDYKHIKYTAYFNIPEFIKRSEAIVGKMEDGELAITLPKIKEGEEGNELKMEID